MGKETKEWLSHQAYEDVLDGNDPLYPENEIYMDCYRFWLSIKGDRFEY